MQANLFVLCEVDDGVVTPLSHWRCVSDIRQAIIDDVAKALHRKLRLFPEYTFTVLHLYVEPVPGHGGVMDHAMTIDCLRFNWSMDGVDMGTIKVHDLTPY